MRPFSWIRWLDTPQSTNSLFAVEISIFNEGFEDVYAGQAKALKTYLQCMPEGLSAWQSDHWVHFFDESPTSQLWLRVEMIREPKEDIIMHDSTWSDLWARLTMVRKSLNGGANQTVWQRDHDYFSMGGMLNIPTYQGKTYRIVIDQISKDSCRRGGWN